MSFTMTPTDFGNLCNTSMKWDDINWKCQEYRFETVDNESIDFTYKQGYWLGEEYSSVLFAKMFLSAQGYSYQVLWDMAENPNPQWLIVTNYER